MTSRRPIIEGPTLCAGPSIESAEQSDEGALDRLIVEDIARARSLFV